MLQQLTEMIEGKTFRSQQTLALAKTGDLSIQKIIKGEVISKSDSIAR